MMPSERVAGPDYPYYDNVVAKLESHFRSLTDESVDVAIFNNLKQGKAETALEYEFRVKQVAKRVNETNEPMIRTRYLEGMNDKELSGRAFVDGTPLQDVVRMATRKEAIVAKNAEFSPWGVDPIAVAAIADNDDSSRWPAYRPRGRMEQSRGYRRGGNSSFRAAEHSRRLSAQHEGTKCPNCGIAQHRGSHCPATEARCFKCDKIGHFQYVCTAKVLSIASGNENQFPEVGEQSI